MEAKEGNKTPDCMDESRIRLFMKAANIVLIKVKDFYVGALSDCSTQLDYSGILSCPAGQVPATLPHSFSLSSTKLSSRRENHNGISRAASAKPFAGERQRLRKSPTAVRVLPRSYSVVMGKIDEENTCEFEEVGGSAGGYKRQKPRCPTEKTDFLTCSEDHFVRSENNERSVVLINISF